MIESTADWATWADIPRAAWLDLRIGERVALLRFSPREIQSGDSLRALIEAQCPTYAKWACISSGWVWDRETGTHWLHLTIAELVSGAPQRSGEEGERGIIGGEGMEGTPQQSEGPGD